MMWTMSKMLFIVHTGTDEELQYLDHIMNSDRDEDEKKKAFELFLQTDEMKNRCNAYNYIFQIDGFREIKRKDEDRAFKLLKEITHAPEIVSFDRSRDLDELNKIVINIWRDLQDVHRR